MPAMPVPTPRGEQATLRLLKRFPHAAIFGFLLTPDRRHPIVELLRERWYEYHNLTGDKFWLVLFEPPSTLKASLKEYWRKRLGKNFAKVWAFWEERQKTESDNGEAYKYGKFFVKGLRPSQMPCLLLFPDPGRPQAILRPIPKWEKEDLHELLTGLIEATVECCEEPTQKGRLECLRKALTSPTSRTLAQFKRARRKTLAYLTSHPAQIATTAASFIFALNEASVLPIALGATATAVLQAVKDLKISK